MASVDTKTALVASAVLIVVGGAIYQYNKIKQGLSDAHQAGRDTIRPVTNAIWNVYSFLKGEPEHVVSDMAGFVLAKKHIAADGKISEQWRRNIELMNAGNAQLFNVITDEQGRLKSEYRHLVDGIVDYETTKRTLS